MISNATFVSLFASYISQYFKNITENITKFMLNIRRSFIYIAAALSFAAVSCQLDDTLYYNNMTMGNVVDGRFVSDQGNIFNVVEQKCAGNLQDEKRIIVLCDVLNETEGAADEYDVRLNQYAKVLEKNAVEAAEATEGEIAVQDPIQIEELWFSGGYINMQIRFLAKKDSKTKHLVNLVYSKNEEGKYVMNFRHNGFGEVYSKENQSDMYFSSGYVSFPLTFVQEKEAKFVFSWKWYKSPGTGYDFSEEKEYSVECKWKREGFEQVPNAVSFKSSSELR